MCRHIGRGSRAEIQRSGLLQSPIGNKGRLRAYPVLGPDISISYDKEWYGAGDKRS